jgi:DNA-binding Xre family transcriptional regulator
MNDDPTLKNARYLARVLREREGSWSKAAEGLAIDQATLWRLGTGKTTSVDASLLRALALAVGEETALALAVDLERVRS